MLTHADVCWGGRVVRNEHAGRCSSKAGSLLKEDTDTREQPQQAQHACEQEEENGRRNIKEARGFVEKRGNERVSKESGSKESGSKESGSKESWSCSDRRSAQKSPFRETRAGGRSRDAAGWAITQVLLLTYADVC